VVDDHGGVVLVVIRISYVVENPSAVSCVGPRHVSDESVSASFDGVGPVVSRVSAVVVVNSVAVNSDFCVKTLGDQRRINAKKISKKNKDILQT
jgi:hypothetical protein